VTAEVDLASVRDQLDIMLAWEVCLGRGEFSVAKMLD
jgi:hypothetical protein